MGKLCGGQRPAEEVPLSFRAAVGLKECELFVRFDAFGNHALLEVLAHINDGADDGRIIRIARDLLDEGLVNLQDLNGKLSEIAEAGIAVPKSSTARCTPILLSSRSTEAVDSACWMSTLSVSSRSR
jgi:hypothetical protein